MNQNCTVCKQEYDDTVLVEFEAPEGYCWDCLGIYGHVLSQYPEGDEENHWTLVWLIHKHRTLPDHHKRKLEKWLDLVRGNDPRIMGQMDRNIEDEVEFEEFLEAI